MATEKTEKIEWVKQDMGGWFRHEGTSPRFGPYVVEKEDTKSYSVWWGDVDIGEADNVASAKKVAQKHCDWLAYGSPAREPS